MKTLKSSIITLAIITLVGFSHLANAKKEVVVPDDGLTLIKKTDSTLAYKRENVDFSLYKDVYIIPSKVAFKKNWKRAHNNSQGSGNQRLNDKDVAELETDMANLFDKVFKEELSKGNVKKVVETNNDQTLILKPYIINLDLTAPSIKNTSNTRTFVKEVGEATLYLEMFDGKTGEILARVIDDELLGNDSFAKWATKARNTADTTRTIKKWAQSLNEAFEKAQTKAN